MEKLMIGCDKATLLIVKKEDTKLSLSSKLSLYIHLILCKYCKLFEKQNKFISKNIPLSSEISFSESEKLNLIKSLSP